MATQVPTLQSDRWTSPEFWHALLPSLHIVDADYVGSVPLFDVEAGLGETLRAQMRVEGYVQLPPPQWDLPLAKMAALVARLDAEGIPLPFAFLFDEFWILFVKLGRLIETQLGPGFFMLPDFWVWLIDPQRDQAGWTPHRDKGHYALREDGSPKSVTVWIPLTDASTLNGCMYLVPADRDPTYGTPNDREWTFAYPDIRALPAQAGSVLMWNQAVLHWGSHANTRETRPRISAAFEFQAGDIQPFNTPLMQPGRIPPFGERLKLVAKQILQYRHMYTLAPAVQAAAQQILELP